MKVRSRLGRLRRFQCGLSELAGGARDGEVREAVERDDVCARMLGQARDAHEEWEEQDIPIRHAVARLCEGFERGSFDLESGVEMLFELGSCVVRDLNGGELPKA